MNATKVTDCGCLWMEIKRRERMTVTKQTKNTNKIPPVDPSAMMPLPFAITPQKTKEQMPENGTNI